jgi:hypothetical protein
MPWCGESELKPRVNKSKQHHNLSKKWGLARFFPGSLGKKRACPRFFAAVGPHIVFIVYE